MAAPAKPDALTRDAFLGGRVTLVQPARGHRAGLDAALLQALVPAAATGVALDLGAGIGTVAFSIAARAPGLSVIGIERDAGLVACGREALALAENSSFAARVKLTVADAADAGGVRASAGLSEGGTDFVLTNPPFNDAAEGSLSPDPLRRSAHAGKAGLLEAWCGSAAALLRPGGSLGLIHRADRLAEVLAALSGRFGDIRVLPVHPTADAGASRILVTARHGRRTPLTLLPGLVLHAASGAWTLEADAILRGAAELAA